jgi:shikimate 5-dehydrogenase
MFVYQGARQFELWTGISAPMDIMRMAAETELTDSR